jgi:tRNA G37 N-methylase Trm5
VNILRHFNFKGKNRLIKWLGLSTGLDRIVPWGKKSLIKVNNTELIGFDIFWNGGYENDIHWCLDNIINENSVCVDIGANIGVYTILLAEISKTVHAVEPNSNFRDLLNSNIRLNNFNNIKVYDSGISKNGGVKF